VYFDGGYTERFYCILRDRWENLKDLFGLSEEHLKLVARTIAARQESPTTLSKVAMNFCSIQLRKQRTSVLGFNNQARILPRPVVGPLV